LSAQDDHHSHGQQFGSQPEQGFLPGSPMPTPTFSQFGSLDTSEVEGETADEAIPMPAVARRSMSMPDVKSGRSRGRGDSSTDGDDVPGNVTTTAAENRNPEGGAPPPVEEQPKDPVPQPARRRRQVSRSFTNPELDVRQPAAPMAPRQPAAPVAPRGRRRPAVTMSVPVGAAATTLTGAATAAAGDSISPPAGETRPKQRRRRTKTMHAPSK
jgi:hypothetical protein